MNGDANASNSQTIAGRGLEGFVMIDDTSFSGVINPCLCTMAEVSGAWLHVGNLFPSRDILAL